MSINIQKFIFQNNENFLQKIIEKILYKIFSQIKFIICFSVQNFTNK